MKRVLGVLFFLSVFGLVGGCKASSKDAEALEGEAAEGNSSSFEDSVDSTHARSSASSDSESLVKKERTKDMYAIVGTITEVDILDRSKTAKVKNFHTYVTLKVEETEPPDVIDKIHRDAQEFTRRTVPGVDENLAAGQRVRILVSSIRSPVILGIWKITVL